MKIVVTEDSYRRIAERLYFAQHRERAWASIDEIADQPQPVALRGEADQAQELAEFRVAALNVADGVKAHEGNGRIVDVKLNDRALVRSFERGRAMLDSL